ncbi:MAG: hypothetical protein RBU37_05465 [Myxococcota bacterium]|jgi:hypothetical protein|nr:hypothetical protein [Myxococcota bacterium]
MSQVTRVVFWSTSFQADVWSLAMYLAARPEFELKVAMHHAKRYLDEPLAKLAPPPFELLERDDSSTLKAIRAFAPHVVIVDNHFPPKKLAPALFVLWHGFGWKGPNDRKEFASVYKAIKSLTGICPSKPNPHFIWQCFGPTDLEHRHRVSGFARTNLRSLGAAMCDDLAPARFTREQLLPYYPASFAQKPIALLAFTWHYGSVFAHWGEDRHLFQRLFEELRQHGYAIVVRMHDRHRYEPSYLRDLQSMAQGHDDLWLKFKDEHRDNLIDLSLAELTISNFSSILNYTYATGKPSLHVYPVASGEEAFLWRTWKNGKLRIQRVDSARYIWKLPPEANGGLLARSPDELWQQVHTAATQPDCCQQASQAFIAEHMAPTDGRARERIANEIIALAEHHR